MRKPAVYALALALTATLALGLPAHDEHPASEDYRTPYHIQFHFPVEELLADIDNGERGNPFRESAIPHRDWDARHVRTQYGAWGPPARHYAAPPHVLDRSVQWKRERTIAVALRFVGYGYQHHHIPDWEPPRGWPWKPCCVGHNGKGVDCSNFTSFVYNLGFGMKPTSETKQQSRLHEFPGPGPGRHTRVRHIELPDSYEKLVEKLQTGDLIYIRNRREKIAHVVLWVGSIGSAPDKTPLIIDSHGGGVKDSSGVNIPCGIQVRPFRDNSWYHHSADHAIRVWHED
jgi:cell wall-associated NlpC family hydrolase